MTMPPSMRSADHLSGDASPARFDPAAVRIPGHEITREHAGAGRKCGGPAAARPGPGVRRGRARLRLDPRQPKYLHLANAGGGKCIDGLEKDPGDNGAQQWRCLNTPFEEWRYSPDRNPAAAPVSSKYSTMQPINASPSFQAPVRPPLSQANP
jgi:hypothetical protein